MRFPTLLVVALAAAALSACSDPGSTTTGPRSEQFKCARDIHTVDAIIEAINAHDDDDYKAAIQSTVPVPPGTPVRLVAHTLGQSPKVEVEVTAGQYKGQLCWFPRNIDGILGS